MKSEHITTTQVILHLTEEEAHWLNDAMRNPFSGHSPATEDPIDAEMRQKFFNATLVTLAKG